MSTKSIFCLATSRHQANRVVDHLRAESFSKNDISVLYANQGAMPESRHENITKAAADAVAGAGPDSFIGEPLNWVAGIGALAIPGLGPFVAAGPIIAALSAAGGDIGGGLMSLGISEMEARRYERELDNGNILLCVHTDDAGDIARAKDIFKQAAAQNTCCSGEAATRLSTPSEGGSHPVETVIV
jgi:hypothetical protein